MEHEQQQIESLLVHLRDEHLVPRSSRCRWDRPSTTLCVRADFTNGGVFTLNITDRKIAHAVLNQFQANLKVQFAQTSEFRDLLKLEIGKRYTLLVNSEMGLGVAAVQLTLEETRAGHYAQYDDAVEVIFKKKGARNLRAINFHGNKSYAIFDGWITVNTDPFGPVIKDGPISHQRSKYLSFDDRYMTDAIASAGVPPLFTKLYPMIRREKSAQ